MNTLPTPLSVTLSEVQRHRSSSPEVSAGSSTLSDGRQLKIAICSPSANAYSETFIAAHRRLLPGVTHFYHSGPVPAFLESSALAAATSPLAIARRAASYLRLTPFSAGELHFRASLRRVRPDVVLAEYGTTAAEILAVVRDLGIPLVVHFHGYDASKRETISCYADRYRKVFSYASRIISVSKVMTEALERMGCERAKIVQTCYGPNAIFFDAQPGYVSRRFVGVGRFVDKKAPHYTILAFSQVVRQFPDAELRLIGDGTLRSVCEDLVRCLGLERNVTFLGVLTPEEVLRELNGAIAFVQHSKTAADGDMEGTPVGIIEAQAAALPVIATYHAGIPEVVLDQETGLLGQEHDVEAMARHMARILASPGEARRLGAAGRRRVRERFTMDAHISALADAIRSSSNRDLAPEG